MYAALLLVMAGLCAVSSQAKQFHFVYDHKSLTEARKYCREKYTDLVTIADRKDVETLNDMADLSKMRYPDGAYHLAWIGLYKDVYRWRWSLSDSSYYRHGEAEFTRWQHGRPIKKGLDQGCTWMDHVGEWVDVSCGTRTKPVCLYVTGSKVKFIYVNTSMNWTEAHSYCRDKYTDLASVRNLTENQQVQELIPAGESAWIGLFGDTWKWSDGSNSTFRYWGDVEPNDSAGEEQCVVAYFGSSGRWEDWPCDRERAFICYSQPEPPKLTTNKQVFRLSLSKEDSSLILNDPAVAQSLLKQIKQKLKDQGLSDDVKLSWRKQPGGKIFHKEEKKKKKTTKDEL